ncbi:hypothetical protein [Halorussus amylolyticus]|uniref:hypothetical protein n=1 Tax=Halorussus amylolyticus TaxID=1126242 RepID=UPI0010526A54|nr:hypothetical protein [Halorussus amylolyticus]
MKEDSKHAVAAALGLLVAFAVGMPIATSGPLRPEMYYRIDVVGALALAWIFLAGTFPGSETND